MLPIVFDKSISTVQKNKFFSACSEWEAISNIKCVQGPYKGRKLRVSKRAYFSKGCWSMIGMSSYFMGIKRTMNLGDGCWSRHTIIHEVGHALGLTHEHQRPDRDAYVFINSKNVKDPLDGMNRKLNFSTQKSELLTPYDFLSIMHFSTYSFSKNSKPTIVPLKKYLEYQYIIGRAEVPSKLDGESIRALYRSKILGQD